MKIEIKSVPFGIVLLGVVRTAPNTNTLDVPQSRRELGAVPHHRSRLLRRPRSPQLTPWQTSAAPTQATVGTAR